MNNRVKSIVLIVLLSAMVVGAGAQEIVFDFENAPVHTSLPVSLSAGGLTANFTATGQGFSIQPANTMGFTPVGFSGLCLYPNSIYASDLRITFSLAVTNFSILYAPQELACDSSATMRVTAFMNGTNVGTSITNAQAGTWPTETLRFSSRTPFNSVVVHYDKPPVTGGDWGSIFMADNVQVALAPTPVAIDPPMRLANGAFQFSFTNAPGTGFVVLRSTNLVAPLSSWAPAGAVAEILPGQYEFTDPSPSDRQGFYTVVSP